MAAAIPVSQAENPGIRPGLPDRVAARVAAESLPAEVAFRAQAAGGELERVVERGEVLGRNRNLDDLEAGGRLEHPVADPRGLNETVPGFEAEGRALIFVHHVHPAPVAEDELEGGDVVVDVVGHRSRLRDADVRGDDRPAEAPRDEVPVVHAGAADPPRAAVGALPLHHQGVPSGWAPQAGMEIAKLDAGAVGGVELPHAVSQCGRVLAVEPDHAGSVGGAAFEPDAHAVARQHRLRGVVGGKDGFETEIQPFAEEGEIRGQVAARQEHFGPCRAARSGIRRRPIMRSGFPDRMPARLVVQRNPPRRASHRVVPTIVALSGG